MPMTRACPARSSTPSLPVLNLVSSSLPSSSWLSRLATLKAARTQARGIAPHKPLMRLTVIVLIESGNVPDGWVRYDVRLTSPTPTG